ncbi:Sugar phosphate isomerase/epimerase [Malonomonas rubra DSM 5091]|uniref:Sugar phosphate isomerase/epimerase n=1 Tax=Malonomonas rubra DSM 5091 TaxID=1122189 RepID=A0A1M6IAE6_MALRU|nr:sugar phosphate isomerase/epimerase [Malonomonas rubra]SHJ31338.1 Sugar phosphate isomerase/epimerase [Malonomonas rubra DSM 5091]
MKINLSAGSLHTLPPRKVFEIARDVGFAGIEIIINHDYEYGAGKELLAEVVEILPVASIHAPFFEINGWGNKIDQLNKTVRLAKLFDIPLVNFHPPVWLGLERKFWRWMNKISDFQQDVGEGEVIVTIENMPATGPLGCNPYFLSNTGAMIDFMDKHNLYLTFDTAHMGTYKTNFLTDFHHFYNSGRIRNVHFSDYANGREHLLPGHGKLPLTRFLNHLQQTGYDGTLTLELTPSELPESEELICASLSEILTYIREQTGQALQSAV